MGDALKTLPRNTTPAGVPAWMIAVKDEVLHNDSAKSARDGADGALEGLRRGLLESAADRPAPRPPTRPRAQRRASARSAKQKWTSTLGASNVAQDLRGVRTLKTLGSAFNKTLLVVDVLEVGDTALNKSGADAAVLAAEIGVQYGASYVASSAAYAGTTALLTEFGIAGSTVGPVGTAVGILAGAVATLLVEPENRAAILAGIQQFQRDHEAAIQADNEARKKALYGDPLANRLYGRDAFLDVGASDAEVALKTPVPPLPPAPPARPLEPIVGDLQTVDPAATAGNTDVALVTPPAAPPELTEAQQRELDFVQKQLALRIKSVAYYQDAILEIHRQAQTVVDGLKQLIEREEEAIQKQIADAQRFIAYCGEQIAKATTDEVRKNWEQRRQRAREFLANETYVDAWNYIARTGPTADQIIERRKRIRFAGAHAARILSALDTGKCSGVGPVLIYHETGKSINDYRRYLATARREVDPWAARLKPFGVTPLPLPSDPAIPPLRIDAVFRKANPEAWTTADSPAP